MDQTELTAHITTTFPDVETQEAMGYIFFFVGSERKLPFATIALEDNEYDMASNLSRPGVYRLNMGVGHEAYRAMFGPQPKPAADPTGTVDTGHDFAALDQIMPHPTYAPQSWVSVLNPGEATMAQVKTLLAGAYEIAAKRGRRGGEET